MKIYAETEDGNRLEIKNIAGLGEGSVLLIKSSAVYAPIDRARIELDFENRIGKPVVLIDGRFDVIGEV